MSESCCEICTCMFWRGDVSCCGGRYSFCEISRKSKLNYKNTHFCIGRSLATLEFTAKPRGWSRKNQRLVLRMCLLVAQKPGASGDFRYMCAHRERSHSVLRCRALRWYPMRITF